MSDDVWSLSFSTAPWRKRKDEPVSDINRFKLNGLYKVDIEHEIEYWESRKKALLSPQQPMHTLPEENVVEPIEEDDEDDYWDEVITLEYCEARIVEWSATLEHFHEAFEKQRPKIDYDDGSWE